MSKLKPFPATFLWGASTSAHQVEGNNHNQWSDWEFKNAQSLASNSKYFIEQLNKYGYPINWAAIKSSAQDPNNYISGNADEHYEHYAADFQLLKKLKLNSYRFSVEWSRIQPSKNQWDQTAIKHYHQYIQELKQLSIEPILTIWHWTMPGWFCELGGFEKKENLKYFYDFVSFIGQEYSQDLKFIIILNEPNSYTSLGYGLGLWPPARKNLVLSIKVYRNLMAAHVKSYHLLKQHNSNLQIGIAMTLSDTAAAAPNSIVNKLAIKIKDYLWNWWFLDKCRSSLDFIGINFYFKEFINWRFQLKNPAYPVSDLGAYMEPSAIYSIIKKTWSRYGKTLIITENGLADSEDKNRIWWLSETINALQLALNDGINIIGYLHWSLLDNFEWAFGWWPKFGLVKVNRETQERTIKRSAIWLANKISELAKP